MATKKKYTIAEVKRLVADVEDSPLTVAAACSKFGITVSQYYSWRKMYSSRFLASEDEEESGEDVPTKEPAPQYGPADPAFSISKPVVKRRPVVCYCPYCGEDIRDIVPEP